MTACRPKLAVFKFASCDGCQLQLLDLEGQLRQMAEQVEIAHFLEARSRIEPGP
ncbi:MAG: oxidoreductase, partial [Planctomycetia bacterium]|nr:oxidoreductase [Planctomycetia bacterium]